MHATIKHKTVDSKHDIQLICYINDKFINKTVTVGTSALQILREELQLKGTNNTQCLTGDCGGCTIALGKWQGNNFQYQEVNSCILSAARLHGCHIITVEGLAQAGGGLHLIQKEMSKQHAVRCGYCTAGIIIIIFCLFCNNRTPNNIDIISAFAGNLCSCTGYKCVNDALLAIIYMVTNNKTVFLDIIPSYAQAIHEKLKKTPSLVRVPAIHGSTAKCKNYYLPQSLQELFTIMGQLKKQFNIINGGTELLVKAKLHNVWPINFIDISQIAQLNFIRIYTTKIVIGGNVTLTQVQMDNELHTKLPILQHAILQMGSRQIRNLATLVGGITNELPPTESTCVLLALNATLYLKSKNKTRSIKLEDFYATEPAKFDKTSEIIVSVAIPLGDGMCDFMKTKTRGILGVKIINSCIKINMVQGIIKKCRIAIGGVAKYPALPKRACAFLEGKQLIPNIMLQTAQIASKELLGKKDIKIEPLVLQKHICEHLRKFTLKPI